MKVLVIRSEAAASSTAAALEKLGHQPVLMPMFELVDTQAELPRLGFNGFVFTSRNALKVLKERNWCFEDLTLPVFCVGDKTAKAAGEFGFTQIFSAKGNARDLAALIKEKTGRRKTLLLYPTTPDRKADLETALLNEAIDLLPIEIYQMIEKHLEAEKIQAALQQAESVLLYSERSAGCFFDAVSKNNLHAFVKPLCVIAISHVASERVSGLKCKKILVSRKPNEEFLLRSLESCNR